MQTRPRLLPTVILLWISRAFAANFTFSYGDATQCDDFAVSWSGGTAPFELTIIPAFDKPFAYSIPSSNFSNGQGSYQVQLTIAENTSMLAVMSDATGFASGGVSDVITVGTGSSGCNTSAQAVDFYFDTNLALNQCRTYSFSGYTGAKQPINITGIVPGGTSFVLNPPNGPTSFDWTSDLASGTSVLFFMTDSEGHSGGSTQIDTVGITDDTSCLTGAFPSSVAVHPSAMYTSSSSQSATATSVTDATKSTVSGGTIAGAVVGGLLGLGFIVAAVVFFLLRRRRHLQYFEDGSYTYRTTRRKEGVDLAHEAGDDMPPAVVHPYPFFNPTDSMVNAEQPHSAVSLIPGDDHPASSMFSLTDPFGVSTHSRETSLADSAAFPGPAPGLRDSLSSSSQAQSLSSSARRKAAMAGVATYQPSPRFILHTDAEEVIELPPQYSSIRAPSSLTGPSVPEDQAEIPPASSSADLPPFADPPPFNPASTSSGGPSSGILEDQISTAGLQEPLTPGPSSTGLTPPRRRADDHDPGHSA